MHTGEAANIQREIDQAKRALDAANAKLARLKQSCNHKWGDIKYIPEHREGYTIPGDAPGTMGIDWRGPTYVPSSTTKKWSRTCTVCGYCETTTQTKKQPITRSGSIPGATIQGTEEVPYFSPF